MRGATGDQYLQFRGVGDFQPMGDASPRDDQCVTGGDAALVEPLDK